ncbi:Sulfhydryl oxidase 1 [Pseudolycoriella hygida]|uniref:Sulfhydryl oxidase n=1 Tax=Pseudolycoriella hygida TaxID=35572 RepID=A0A9Q0N021_9DIPT|nr:Sulfhydryl oxidase 1 [Pseudolycoriella hygida]
MRLMLDYHREKDFIVRQINSSETAELYGIENKSTIHVIDKELRIEILPTEIYHNYKTIKSNLENYLMDHGIVMQQEEDNSNSSTVPNVDSSLSDSETTILNKIVNLTHVVFQADLEKALKLSLTTEVFKNPEIEGESLQALRRYVAVVQKYSPLGAKGYDFFADLSNFINSSSDGIDGTAYKEKIHELENKTEIFDLHWVGCQGSAPNYRGYSCGLWTLFHYLTIRAANSIDDNDPIEVLSTIEKYVKHFFGCTECAIHFQEMAVERDMWNVTTTDQAILWLWKAHNIVNDRLSGDVTDDPLFPKIKFPSYRACQKCRSGFNFSENEVLLYLKDLYSDEKINNFGMESIDEDNVSR